MRWKTSVENWKELKTEVDSCASVGILEGMPIITLHDIVEARSRLDGITLRTPLIELDHGDGDRRLFLKAENQQPIGAFKLRGA